ALQVRGQVGKHVDKPTVGQMFGQVDPGVHALVRAKPRERTAQNRAGVFDQIAPQENGKALRGNLHPGIIWMPGTPLRCFPVDAAYFEFISYLPKDAGMNSLLDRLLAKGRALAAAAGLVEAGKAEQAAAARLRASGRVPINIWGDVLLDGSDPVVRRVLTGKDGHESLLSFFYLNEFLALNEVVKAIPAMEASSGWPKPAT